MPSPAHYQEKNVTYDQLKAFHTYHHLLDKADASRLKTATEKLLGKGSSATAKAQKAPTKKASKAPAEPTDQDVLARLFL